jgi:hypothetical protein
LQPLVLQGTALLPHGLIGEALRNRHRVDAGRLLRPGHAFSLILLLLLGALAFRRIDDRLLRVRRQRQCENDEERGGIAMG